MSGLERIVTSEDLEYASRQIIIEARRHQVAVLQDELGELSAGLNEFERQYRARIGTVQSEIDRLRKEITDYRNRITHLKARIASRDPGLPDPPPFDDDHEGPDPEFERHAARKRRPPLDPETAEALRTVYRQLAKRFHPDLATNREERERREEMMLRINDAFAERNLAALEAIARESEHADPEFGFRPIIERLAWASLEISRLDSTIAGLESQIKALRSSRTYEYWRATERIDDVIERLAVEAHDKSEKLAEKLNELVVSHDKLRARLDARQRFRQIAERRLRAS
jgi:DNA repair exonuclease SbcCD ATPase subunit